MRSLIAAGEFFFDLIFYKLERLPRMGEELVTPNFTLVLGGGAATTAIVAARLGRRVQLATVLGDTSLDEYAIDELKKQKITPELIKRQSNSMGAITVAVSLPKDRFFLTYPGANVFLEKYLLSSSTRKKLAAGAHVHFALSPREWKPYAGLLQHLKSQGLSTSWDLGWHPEAVRRPGFRECYAALDIVFLNRIEALKFANEKTVEKAIRKLAMPGQVVVVKLGAEGAMALGPTGLLRSKGMGVKAIDTTGAGDAFNGGFLHAWLDGKNLRHCLRTGNICGALSTTKPGGSAAAPNETQLARFLRKLK
ncbi:MAG TPA: carbohydrate kinase family protein [Terriglobales bacterium]|nr:carbohydrate kinase family protein [Terriglobales bacterium]